MDDILISTLPFSFTRARFEANAAVVLFLPPALRLTNACHFSRLLIAAEREGTTGAVAL
jgi:hypothetical protein